ncbi:acyltransferase ChoActase/COT/CPT [Umbelopsis sp. PMI_123]|nr:acyltransferase ChoActase/COT/CPT [Umbelopsis sp. PMI_123]
MAFVNARRTLATFANQSKIPRLPIPTLQETANRYKRSLLPLLTSADYDRASAAVDDFIRPGGLGEKLQERLHELDKKEPDSWLDTLWLNKAYLEYREPTLINVNWWNQFIDPPSGLVPSPGQGRVSDLQLDRAALFLSQLTKFNDMINKEQIPPDVSRAGPMCMNQLKNQFGASRIPDEPRDRIVTTWPANAKHATVIYKDQVFSVPIIGENGELPSIQKLRSQLENVVQQVDSIPQNELQPPIGVLTSEHRNTWAKLRKSMEKDTVNAGNFDNIDASLFALCLDDYASELDLDKAHRNLFHGQNARNRWFDKAMQFIVENNGRAGVNGEHSPADAVIPGSMFTEILKREEQGNKENNLSNSASLANPRHLLWNIDSTIGNALVTAENNAYKMIDNLSSVLLHYNDFGSDFLKRVKCSPDGFLQMAYQLAYYRQHGQPCATYESASTRMFKFGRTETVRSCSVDTVAFTKAWDDKDVKFSDKVSLFQKAVGSHLEYMKAASNGKGVDRHLLGLRCMMTQEEATKAAIFNDPSYIQSMYFKLSTSNTSPGDYSWGGFGPVVPEGYGSNYAIGKERIRLSISAWKSAPEAEANMFRTTLRKVFDDLGEAIERA